SPSRSRYSRGSSTRSTGRGTRPRTSAAAPPPGPQNAPTNRTPRGRGEGSFALDARPIPNSREFIDHLVVGPTGVYAIDSEKWDAKLPIRTWNGKKLYHGPESQKERRGSHAW